MLGIALVAWAAYLALFGGEYGLLELRHIRQETTVEAERLAALQDELDRLHARVDSLESDTGTIERIARERWGLIRPGERLYRFEDGAPDRGGTQDGTR